MDRLITKRFLYHNITRDCEMLYEYFIRHKKFKDNDTAYWLNKLRLRLVFNYVSIALIYSSYRIFSYSNSNCKLYCRVFRVFFLVKL